MTEFERQDRTEGEIISWPTVMRPVGYAGWLDNKDVVVMRFEDPKLGALSVALPAQSAAELIGNLSQVLAALPDARAAWINAQTDNN